MCIRDRFWPGNKLGHGREDVQEKWNSIKQIEIKGIKHHLMEADLDYYKPSNLIRPSSHLVRN